MFHLYSCQQNIMSVRTTTHDILTCRHEHSYLRYSRRKARLSDHEAKTTNVINMVAEKNSRRATPCNPAYQACTMSTHTIKHIHI